MTVKTALFIKRLDGWISDARLYQVTPPMNSEERGDCEYVVVSAIFALMTGSETLIFASDENGTVEDFSSMQGSYRGGTDHEEALGNAGYTVLK